MTVEEREMLRKRMGEVAALPPDHPDRQAIVVQISTIGGDLEREWLVLLQFDEQLRLDLARVPVPADLQEKLLKIPSNAVRSQGRIFRNRRVLALAAAVLLALGIWAAVVVSRGNQPRAVANVASLVAAEHELQPVLSVTSPRANVVSASLQQQVAYPVVIPQLPHDPQLIGGTVLNLDGHKVVYTRWNNGKELCSLYQFCGPDFGVRHFAQRQKLEPAPGQSGHRCSVFMWTEGHCDYALVMESPHSGADVTSGA